MNPFLFALTADAANPFMTVISPVIALLNSFINPLLAIIGALGTIFCIVIGVKFAKAEEPQEREKAKNALKNAVIGFILVFVLIVALKLLMPVMTTWMTTTVQ